MRFKVRIRRSYVRRSLLLLCTAAMLLALWFNSFVGHKASTAYAATDVSELVQTGVDRYQAGAFLEAIAPWRSAYEVYKTTQDLPALAIVSENLARAYQQLGQTSEEIVFWQQAVATTQALNDPQKLGRLLIEQAQAYSRLGQHRRAIAILCGDETANETASDTNLCQSNSALKIATDEADLPGQIAALGSLGEAYRLSGEADKALDYLAHAQSVSEALDDPTLTAALFNSLGNTAFSSAQVSYRRADEANIRGDRMSAQAQQLDADTLNQAAIDYFQQSYALAAQQQDASAQVRSLLSLIPAYERGGDLPAARQHRELALNTLDQLPNSQVKAFAAIKLADFLEPPAIRASYDLLYATPPASGSQAIALLNQALTIGQAIENPRVISFALGKLGNIAERDGRYSEALQQTQQARLAADQDLAAKDSLYLWEWQMGRILKAQGNLTGSAQAYLQAVNLLQQIRSDILTANRDLQFDFRDTVEPIYRQYAELTINDVPNAVILEKGEQAFEKLDTTLMILDSLKVAELQSYFANDCVIAPVATRVDAVGNSEATAVVSTAILAADTSANKRVDGANFERLAVIVSFPDGRKKISQTTVAPKEIAAQVNQFRFRLEEGVSQYISEYDYQPSQQLYEWLIRPFEQDLAEIKTLVFVNDGPLRSVPMAALHDGQRFLIEKFAVATTPSLTLTDPERIARPTALSALLMGVSEPSAVAGRTFAALPAVDEELATVAEQFPNSEVLLNQEFSLAALRRSLAAKDYRILHMATHGTFGFDPSDNFVVTGAKQEGVQGFNETLTISALDELIRSVDAPNRDAIELLTLTACETAIGDNRSTLGLAGVAIRAGVRSAIATLWSVSDESSAQLISQFYNNLKDPALTKAQAMQKAQIAMIESDDFADFHPYKWAAFTLIGNWL